MSELNLATPIADVDLTDTVELPSRLAATPGMLKMTLLKIKTYIFAKLYAYATPVAVAYGASIALDGSTGINFTIGALTGPLGLANPTNMTTGQSGVIIIPQDATGGRVITYGSKWKFPGGVAAALLSTGANKIDMIGYIVLASGDLYCSIAKDMTT